MRLLCVACFLGVNAVRLLVIEDNRRMATLVADGLAKRGFISDIAHDLSEADHALTMVEYDALVLDLGLPDGNGREWLIAQRRNGEVPPAIMLTARDALEDRVAGLDAGADDYVVKPVALDELAARIRALLRRPGTRLQPVIEVGDIAFNTTTRTASLSGKPLELSRRETDLLELLLRRAGSVVHREVIEDSLYSLDDAVTPNAVEAIVSRLRRKLDEVGVGGTLHTIRGVGYMLREEGA